MDTYIYLLLTLPFLVAVLIVVMLRPDLRKFVLVAGVLGGIVGLISEYWFFQDYWRPPSLLGVAVPSIEDFLFGFGITALGASLGSVLFKRRHTPARKGIFTRVLLIGLAAIIVNLIFINLLHINSIVVCYGIFVAIIVAGLIIHPYLWKAALTTGVIVAIITIATYAIWFGVLDPTYIDRYFLLAGNPFAPVFGGFLPVTELVWYILCGASNAVVYELLNARKNTVQQTFQAGA